MLIAFLKQHSTHTGDAFLTSAFRLLPCNGQLAPKTTDRTETSEASQGWEGGVGERGFELEIGVITRYRNRHSLKIFPPHAPR